MKGLKVHNNRNATKYSIFSFIATDTGNNDAKKRLVRSLIEHGADASKRIEDTSVGSPLNNLIKYDEMELFEYLLKKGADIKNQRTDNYNNLLYLAVDHKSYKIALILINKGFDLNAMYNEYYTPLFLAA